MSQLDGDDGRIEHTEMNKLPAPEFKTCEEEAALGGNLDTAPCMEDDGEKICSAYWVVDMAKSPS